jgi:CDP-diacylglycerol--serine O-phosphatidyltransferase
MINKNRSSTAKSTSEKYRISSIYLLPNLFTTGCLFAGFYSIVMAVNGEFEKAAIAIFVAAVLDSLDGRVARLTNSTSNFGAQFDSLADVVSFGVAPAIFGYVWILQDLGKLGWLAAFIYVAATALRLARFNTTKSDINNSFFQGLPCPAAATLVSAFIWMIIDITSFESFFFTDKWLAWSLWAIFIYCGFCMVSALPYYSFKDAKLRKSVPFLMVVLIALGLVLVSQDPPIIFFIGLLLYSSSGIFYYLLKAFRGESVSLFATERKLDSE